MKIKKIFAQLIFIFSMLFFLAAIVLIILSFFTDYSYKWFIIGSFVLFPICLYSSLFIDTRTPEEKARDAEIDAERKAKEDAEESDRQWRLTTAKTEYNGDLCQTCNAGMSMCDQCGQYSQWR